MIPILYEKDEVDFVSQGLGSLAELFDVDVEEQRNGLFRLTASYPTIGVRYSDISVGKIILSKPNQRDAPHAFRIVSTELDMLGYNLLIEADSITYDLNHNIIKHLSVDSADGQTAMTAIQKAIVNPSIFTFYSDINHVSKTTLDYVNPMEAIMGVQGSFLQMWGGELKRENRRISMFNRRGRDNVSTFRLGKNIAGLKYRVDISSMVTRIIPTKSVQDNDQATTFLEGIPVDSQYIKNYEQIYTLKVDFTDENIKTVSDLNDAAKGWFTDSTNTGKDKPSVTIDIDVMSLQDSSDYQEKFQSLENVALTDTVSVYVPEYGVNVTAIVNEIHYDPIRNRVTKLSVGTAKQSFADSSRTQLSDLQNKVISIREQANQISISANGKNSNYYGNVSPSHPQDGDLWYWKNGEQSGIRQFIDGNWVDLVDSSTQKNIALGVEKAVSDAKSQTNKAISDNNVLLNKTINDVSKQQADLAIKAGDFNNKAQAMADKALSDAKANTATVAQQTASNAQSALDKAKTDLTTGINKEITDRNSAVTALDTKAKGYADSAKADAISVATTADGVINKKIDNTASSITSTISQNKIDAEGKISTAQSSATQALNELKTKVSKTDYDTKTGQLQTDLNTTSDTANQSKQDIVAIKSTNSSQDSRMNSIESDASGTKQTISQLQTTQGQQSGSISTLQERADGFDRTVSKFNTQFNDLQQINQIANSEFTPDFAGWHSGNDQAVADETSDISAGWYRANGRYNSSTAIGNVVSTGVNGIHTDLIPVGSGIVMTGSVVAYSNADFNGTVTVAIDFAYYDSSKKIITNSRVNSSVLKDWMKVTLKATSPANTAYVSFGIVTNGNTGINYYSQPLLVFSDVLGNYVRGSYNNNVAIAKAQLTADQAITTIANYKTDADGRINKAQSDIIQTAKDVTTKVSQSDYDKKTGDLNTSVSKAQQTADTAVTTIGNYKTSNDGRISSAEAKIKANSDLISQSVTKSEYNSKTGELSSKVSTAQQTADSAAISVSQVQSKVNNLSQLNLVNNSQFTPDYNGWFLTNPWGKNVTTEIWNNGIETDDNLGAMWVWHDQSINAEWLYSTPVSVAGNQNVSASITVAMPQVSASNVPIALYIQAYDANKNRVTSVGYNIPLTSLSGRFTAFKLENVKLDPNARYVSLVLAWNIGGRVSFGKPMLVFGSSVGDYVPGQYNNNDKIATQQITIDGITSIVSDPRTGLSTRVQTAEGTLSTVKSTADGAMSKATQTANDITKEISDRSNGDSNTLQSAKTFTQSSISTSETGMKNVITQTSDALITQISSINMVTNSEFDPINVGWYSVGATAGSTVGTPWSLSETTGFKDWSVVNGSKLLLYNVGSWYTSTLQIASAGKVYSGSIVAGRSVAPTTDTALDLRIAFWDSSRKIISYASAGNIITGSAYKGIDKYVIENRIAPSGTSFVSLVVAHSSGNVNDIIGKPMLNAGATASPYSATKETTSSTTILALFKDNWSIGIQDNIGKITSGIVGDTNSLSVINKNIILDAINTTVTGDFWAKAGSFIKLSASNITAGTINGNQINVTNINANNIVSGVISGANLNINLNSGQVAFQKGRIYDMSNRLDINIDQGYISTANSDTRAILTKGKLLLTQPTLFDDNTAPYLSITNTVSGSSSSGASFIARDFATITNEANQYNIFTVPLGEESFSGMTTGKATTGWQPTKLAGADRGVVVSGGKATNGGAFMANSPYIAVGFTKDSVMRGDRVVIWSSYTHLPSSYYRTTSSGSNVYISSDGALVRSSSSSKYKLDIEYEKQSETANKLLTLDPATWHDKFESEQLDDFHDIGVEPERSINMDRQRYYGIIAEDLVKAGLDNLVQRNTETGEVEGVEYSKIGVALIPIVRDLRNRLIEQNVEIERLKESNK